MRVPSQAERGLGDDLYYKLQIQMNFYCRSHLVTYSPNRFVLLFIHCTTASYSMAERMTIHAVEGGIPSRTLPLHANSLIQSVVFWTSPSGLIAMGGALRTLRKAEDKFVREINTDAENLYMDMVNREYKYYEPLLSTLGFSEFHAKEMIKVFYSLDHDGDRRCEFVEFSRFFHIEKTPYARKCFSMMDTDNTGSLNFANFVVACWNYCSYNVYGLTEFSFHLYCKKKKSRIPLEDVFELINDVYDLDKSVVEYDGSVNIKKNTKEFNLKRAQNQIILACGKDRCMDLPEFLHFSETHPGVLRAAFAIQSRLQESIVSTSYWEHMTKKRHTLEHDNQTEDINWLDADDVIAFLNKKLPHLMEDMRSHEQTRHLKPEAIAEIKEIKALEDEETKNPGGGSQTIPIPEHLEDWERLEEKLLHKTLYFIDQSSVRVLSVFKKPYAQPDSTHEKDLQEHRKKHQFNIGKLIEKSGMKQYAHLFEGMNPAQAHTFLEKSLTFKRRKELHMKGEHYTALKKALDVENVPHIVHDNVEHTALHELEDLLEIVGTSVRKTHRPLAPEEIARIARFLWIHRNVLIIKEYTLTRDCRFSQSVLISTKTQPLFSEKQLKKWFAYFEEIDVYQNGYVTHDDFSDSMRSANEKYSTSVFIDCLCNDYGSSQKPGFLDVQDFCCLVELVCLMHPAELLEFSFHELQYRQKFDPNTKKPFIFLGDLTQRHRAFDRAVKGTSDDVNAFLLSEMIRVAAESAQGKALGGFDSVMEQRNPERLYFQGWEMIAKKSPMAYYPCLWMQETLRKKTGLGVKFWEQRRKAMGAEINVFRVHEESVLERLAEGVQDDRDDIGIASNKDGSEHYKIDDTGKLRYVGNDRSHIKMHGKGHAAINTATHRFKHKGI